MCRKKIIILAAALFLPIISTGVFAETSRQIRDDHIFGANAYFAPLSSPFPLGWGLNLALHPSANWSFELDYQNATKTLKLFSIELAETQEKTYTLQARRFFGNSFNLKMGFGERQTRARLPLDILDVVTKDYSLLVSEMQAKFIMIGFGNQWQFSKRYTFVVDWLTANIPYDAEIVQSVADFVEDEGDKNKVRNAEDYLKYYPSGAIFRVEVGVMF